MGSDMPAYLITRSAQRKLTESPGATTSGLMRPSPEGPYELKNASISMSAASSIVDDGNPRAGSTQIQGYPSGEYSVIPNCSYRSRPSAPVEGACDGPLEVAPTASMFLPRAEPRIVQGSRVGMSLYPPPFPAANTRRWPGFCHRVGGGVDID